MKTKYEQKDLVALFHRGAKALGISDIGTLVLTSVGDLISISEYNLTFEELIYLFKHLAQEHPRELELALKMKDIPEANVKGNDTIH